MTLSSILMSKNKVPYVLLVGIEDQLADVFDTKQDRGANTYFVVKME